ncbi:MAG: hypothetical protein ACTS2F_22500 [Thainema sp.]
MTGFRAGFKWIKSMAAVGLSIILCVVGIGLTGCGNRDRTVDVSQVAQGKQAQANITKRLYEVAPPQAIQDLGQLLTAYQPQVKILSPQPNQVLQSTEVSVRLQVRDLPLFKNETFEMGPHLHVILDNQPYQAVYDTSKPLVFSDLEPGTHTLRVFASRPWHESFKNDGAYDQVTFHLFSPTLDNSPTVGMPQLTYSRPKGSYGAEPIMLDFYLKDAPLHFVARQDSEDDIKDWRIRCTINGESFLFDQWQPVYLKGFKTGQNWLKLELLDEDGNLISNAFNSTIRLIDYQPGGEDTLSKLVRDELTAADVQGIVDPNYVPPEPESEIEPEVEPEVEPITPVPTEPPVESPVLEEQPTVKEFDDFAEPTEDEEIPDEEEPELAIPETLPASPEESSDELNIEPPTVDKRQTEPSEAPFKAVEPESAPALETDQDTDQVDEQPKILEPELIPQPSETTLDQLKGTSTDSAGVTKDEPEPEPIEITKPTPKAVINDVPGLIDEIDAIDEDDAEEAEDAIAPPPSSTEQANEPEPSATVEEIMSPTIEEPDGTIPTVQPSRTPGSPMPQAAKDDIFNQSRQRLGRFFERFRQPDAEDKNVPPTLPEIIDEPSLKSLERDLKLDNEPQFNPLPIEPDQPFSPSTPASPDQSTLTE